MAVELIVNIKKFIGLSGDSKPSSVPAGSEFYETDTTDTYVYSAGSWVLRTDPVLAIGDSVSGGTAGSIIYLNASSQIGQDNSNLFYDDSGKNIVLGGSYTFSSDTDTKVYSGSADQLSFDAGGKEAIRLTETTSGNDSLQHTLNGKLGQSTGDEVAYSFNYETNKATSGNDYGLVVNQTDTASPGLSYLMDLQVGGSQKFGVTNGGSIFATSNMQFPDGFGIISNSDNRTLKIQLRNYTAADNAVEVSSGTFFNTSGSSAAVALLPTYNQTSGTSSNTDFLVNRTQTAVGSGEQNLVDLQVSGSSKFKVDNLGTPQYSERSSDPADPPEGYYVQWMSDGTGTGDDGDILIKITAGGSTKTATLVDFSAI